MRWRVPKLSGMPAVPLTSATARSIASARVADAATAYHVALAPKPTAEQVAADLEGQIKKFPADRRRLAETRIAEVRAAQAEVVKAVEALVAQVLEAALRGGPVEVDPPATRDARKKRKAALDAAESAVADLVAAGSHPSLRAVSRSGKP